MCQSYSKSKVSVGRFLRHSVDAKLDSLLTNTDRGLFICRRATPSGEEAITCL